MIHPNFLYPETFLENNTKIIGNKIKNTTAVNIKENKSTLPP